MTENRTATRYPVSLPVTLRVGDRTIEVQARNLSLGGVGVVIGERLGIGTRARVSLRLPGQTTPIDTDAEVRWSNETETGLQFGGLRAREVWELNRFFESLARSR